MTTQRFAQVRVSAQHLNKALFVTLALLVTLVVGQQYHRWDFAQRQAANAAQLEQLQSAYQAQQMSGAAANISATEHGVDQRVADKQIVETHQQRWVF